MKFVMNFHCLVLFIVVLLDLSLGIERHDLSFRMYNAKGEVAQFQYAAKAIEQSPAVVCYEDSDKLVILAAHYRVSPLLSNKLQVIRVVKHNPGIISVAVGNIADGRALQTEVNKEITNHWLLYGSAPALESIISKISLHIVDGFYDEKKMQRPHGAGLLLTSPLKDEKAPFRFLGNTGVVLKRPKFLLGKLTPVNRQVIETYIESTTLSEEERRENILRCLSSEYDCYEGLIVSRDTGTIKSIEVNQLS